MIGFAAGLCVGIGVGAVAGRWLLAFAVLREEARVMRDRSERWGDL